MALNTFEDVKPQKNNAGNTFRRKLMFERLMFRRPNVNVVMVARIKGHIAEKKLKLAIEQLRDKHSLLAVRIEIDDEQNAWFKKEEVPEIPIEVIPRMSDDDWLQKIPEELEYLFEFDRGPLIRFVLLQSQEISDLIVNGHHTICDALGLTYLIKDLMDLLENPNSDIKILLNPPNFEEAILNPPKAGFFFRLLMKLIKKRWDKKKISFNEGDYRKLHREYWKNKNSVLLWSLTESQTSAIISRCREEGVTVYSAICTAFQAAQHDVQGNTKSYFQTLVMPVNLRKMLSVHVGEALALYATSTHPCLKYSSKKSFWEMARIFQKKIKGTIKRKDLLFKSALKIHAIPPSLIDSFFFQKYAILNDKLASLVLKASGLDKIIFGYIISNLGRVDIPSEYGSLKLDTIYGPFIYSDPAEKYLSIVTLAGKMNFCFTFKESVTSRPIIENLRDTAMIYLGKAVGWKSTT